MKCRCSSSTPCRNVNGECSLPAKKRDFNELAGVPLTAETMRRLASIVKLVDSIERCSDNIDRDFGATEKGVEVKDKLIRPALEKLLQNSAECADPESFVMVLCYLIGLHTGMHTQHTFFEYGRNAYRQRSSGGKTSSKPHLKLRLALHEQLKAEGVTPAKADRKVAKTFGVSERTARADRKKITKVCHQLEIDAARARE